MLFTADLRAFSARNVSVTKKTTVKVATAEDTKEAETEVAVKRSTKRVKPLTDELNGMLGAKEEAEVSSTIVMRRSKRTKR